MKKSDKQPPDSGDGEYIYTPYITLKNGKRIYAFQYGLKAFRIRVNRDKRRGKKR